MKHVHYTDVPLETPAEEGIKDLKIRWLISKADGAENFAMRLFEAQPGGHSPWHTHDLNTKYSFSKEKARHVLPKEKHRSKPVMYFSFHLMFSIS